MSWALAGPLKNSWVLTLTGKSVAFPVLHALADGQVKCRHGQLPLKSSCYSRLDLTCWEDVLLTICYQSAQLQYENQEGSTKVML